MLLLLHPLLPLLHLGLRRWQPAEPWRRTPTGGDVWPTSFGDHTSAGRRLRRRSRERGRWYDGTEHIELPFVCESAALPGGTCEESYELREQSCYKHSSEHHCAQFWDAEEECVSEGGHLVAIETPEENSFVQQLCGAKPCWIGLREPANSEVWEWTSDPGRTVRVGHVHTYWARGEPDNSGREDEDVAFMNFWWGEDGDEADERLAPECWHEEDDDFNWHFLRSLHILWYVYLMEWWIEVLVVALYAYSYVGRVSRARPRPFPSTEVLRQGPWSMAAYPSFRFHIFGCCDDFSACLLGCFCLPVRAADTYSAAGVDGFRKIVCLFVSLKIALTLVDFGLIYIYGLLFSDIQDSHCREWLAQLFFALCMVSNRQQLRRSFGAVQAEATGCQDFCLWWCCAPCAVIQEARQVDAVQGVHVRCCCELVHEISPASAVVVQGNVVAGAAPMALASTVGAPVVVVGQPTEQFQQQGLGAGKPVVGAVTAPPPRVGNWVADAAS